MSFSNFGSYRGTSTTPAPSGFTGFGGASAAPSSGGGFGGASVAPAPLSGGGFGGTSAAPSAFAGFGGGSAAPSAFAGFGGASNTVAPSAFAGFGGGSNTVAPSSGGGFGGATFVPGTATALGQAAASGSQMGSQTGNFSAMAPGGFSGGPTSSSSTGFGAGTAVRTAGFGAPTSTGLPTSVGIPSGFQPSASYINPSNYFEVSPMFENLPKFQELRVFCQKALVALPNAGFLADFLKKEKEIYSSNPNGTNLYGLIESYMGKLITAFSSAGNVVASQAVEKARGEMQRAALEAKGDGNAYTAMKGMFDSFKLFLKQKYPDVPTSSSSVVPSSTASLMNANVAEQQRLQAAEQQRVAQMAEQQRLQAAEQQRKIEQQRAVEVIEQQKRQAQEAAAEQQKRQAQEAEQQRQRTLAQEAAEKQRLLREAREQDLLRANTVTIPAGNTLVPSLGKKPQQQPWTIKTNSSIPVGTDVTGQARKEISFPQSSLSTGLKQEPTIPPVIVSGGDSQGHIKALETKVKDLTSTVKFLTDALEEHRRESTLRYDTLMGFLKREFRSLSGAIENLTTDDSPPPPQVRPLSLSSSSSAGGLSFSGGSEKKVASPFTSGLPSNLDSLIRTTLDEVESTDIPTVQYSDISKSPSRSQSPSSASRSQSPSSASRSQSPPSAARPQSASRPQSPQAASFLDALSSST